MNIPLSRKFLIILLKLGNKKVEILSKTPVKRNCLLSHKNNKKKILTTQATGYTLLMSKNEENDQGGDIKLPALLLVSGTRIFSAQQDTLTTSIFLMY